MAMIMSGPPQAAHQFDEIRKAGGDEGRIVDAHRAFAGASPITSADMAMR
jgi:hypothetical protein